MIVDRSDDDAGNKTKFQPLSIIRKPALHIVNSLTNIDAIVREEFKFLLLYSYSSSSADEESSGQDQEQEGGDKDDLEGDN
jgi:hypothetical protein